DIGIRTHHPALHGPGLLLAERLRFRMRQVLHRQLLLSGPRHGVLSFASAGQLREIWPASTHDCTPPAAGWLCNSSHLSQPMCTADFLTGGHFSAALNSRV